MSGRSLWLCTRSYLVCRRSKDLGTCSLVLETMSLSHDDPEFRSGLYILLLFTCLELICFLAFYISLWRLVTVTLMSMWAPLNFRSSFPNHLWWSPGGYRGRHCDSFSRVCRPVSFREPSMYVHSVCHVGRRRVAGGCQGRLLRGI